jgi:hypothetical protein
MQYSRYYVKFGDYGGQDNFSKPRKVILQQNKLVIMGQDLVIIYFELKEAKEEFSKIADAEVKHIHLNLQTLV